MTLRRCTRGVRDIPGSETHFSEVELMRPISWSQCAVRATTRGDSETFQIGTVHPQPKQNVLRAPSSPRGEEQTERKFDLTDWRFARLKPRENDNKSPPLPQKKRSPSRAQVAVISYSHSRPQTTASPRVRSTIALKRSQSGTLWTLPPQGAAGAKMDRVAAGERGGD